MPIKNTGKCDRSVQVHIPGSHDKGLRAYISSLFEDVFLLGIDKNAGKGVVFEGAHKMADNH